MAKAIRRIGNLQAGFAMLGRHGDGRGSVAQQVHDGDTVITELAGNVSVRFLGIDTPEVSFMLPGRDTFNSIRNQAWIDFLTDPLEGASPEYLAALGTDLVDHLRPNFGPNTALNHAHHAEVAHRRCEQFVSEDMETLDQDRSTFHFFMVFAHEIMDGFGRLLCFLNRDQPSAVVPSTRPLSYNERLLEAGVTSPYFIWPNINPFRSQGSVVDAVPTPGDIASTIGDSALARARTFVQQVRTNGDGIFDTTHELGPLMLEPFELRFLARQDLPKRWVLDLSNPAADTLLKPTNYHQIPKIEDRLFVPVEYVPLFVSRGWREQA